MLLSTCTQILFKLCCLSLRFGLAPNYGCCTANFNQGWPKLLQHLVYAYNNGSGLVVAMYAPAHVQHSLPSGQLVTLDIITNYPFNDSVLVDVRTEGSLNISLRVPSWADGASVQVNGNPALPAASGVYILLCDIGCVYIVP